MLSKCSQHIQTGGAECSNKIFQICYSETDPGQGEDVLGIEWFGLLVTFSCKMPTGRKLGQERNPDLKT